MMDATEFMTELADRLSNDKDIVAWCVEKFGRGPTIFLGIDENAPPEQDDYPSIAISGVSRAMTQNHYQKSWDIGIGIGIYEETISSSEIAHGSATVILKKFDGFLLAEAFIDLIEKCIIRKFKVTFQGEHSTVSYYPLFVSYTTATIEQIVNMRR